MYPKLTSDFHMHTHRQSSLAHTYARMHMQNDIPKKGKNKNSHLKKKCHQTEKVQHYQQFEVPARSG